MALILIIVLAFAFPPVGVPLLCLALLGALVSSSEA